MEIRSLAIPDVKLVVPAIHRDARGFFLETFRRNTMKAAGIGPDFVQDNTAFSADVGTIRGLHFQAPPHAQGKLLRVTRGSIFDVAVDLRARSPTFGKHVSTALSAESCLQIWVPPGFAHGYCTLEPNTEVFYKVTAYYAPTSDRGIKWDDGALGIEWPLDFNGAIVSDRDRSHPALKDLKPASVDAF